MSRKRTNELKFNSSAPPTPDILLTHSKHTHTHTHARTHAHTHAHTHARTRTCTHTRAHTHTQAHARVQTNLFELLNHIIKY